jgi:hypothetical protein
LPNRQLLILSLLSAEALPARFRGPHQGPELRLAAPGLFAQLDLLFGPHLIHLLSSLRAWGYLLPGGPDVREITGWECF